MENDINQWMTGSIADLTDSVARLSDKDSAEACLTMFQVSACWMVMTERRCSGR